MATENRVWQRIEQIMRARDWRQEDLCRACGLSNATLSVFKGRAEKNPNAGLAVVDGSVLVDSGGFDNVGRVSLEAGEHSRNLTETQELAARVDRKAPCSRKLS